jgi:lipopolysaccharide biosynthesis regulator YciM
MTKIEAVLDLLAKARAMGATPEDYDLIHIRVLGTIRLTLTRDRCHACEAEGWNWVDGECPECKAWMVVVPDLTRALYANFKRDQITAQHFEALMGKT